MLLAAGRGQRLRPLTDSRPKCLLEVAGSPLLVRAIDLIAARGFTNFTIVDGYRGDMIRRVLTERFPAAWFHFVRNDEWDSTNNAASLLLARGTLAEEMFLLDADIAFAPEALDLLLGDPHANRLALRSRGLLGEEEMKVRLGPDGAVAELGKSIPAADAAGESLGLEVFSAGFTLRLFDELERRVRAGHGRHEFYEAAFVALIQAGQVVHPVDMGDTPCVEIDTAEDLAYADRVFRRVP